MKNKTILLLAVLIMCICLTECSKNKPETQVTAFLQEFYTANSLNRYTILMQTAQSEGLTEQAIVNYHEGIRPYLTDDALLKIELERRLFQFDSICHDKADSWSIEDISLVRQNKEIKYYDFSVLISSDKQELDFSGSITLDDNNRISNVYFAEP